MSCSGGGGCDEASSQKGGESDHSSSDLSIQDEKLMLDKNCRFIHTWFSYTWPGYDHTIKPLNRVFAAGGERCRPRLGQAALP